MGALEMVVDCFKDEDALIRLFPWNNTCEKHMENFKMSYKIKMLLFFIIFFYFIMLKINKYFSKAVTQNLGHEKLPKKYIQIYHSELICFWVLKKGPKGYVFFK